jgi:hypothetical protein
MWLIFGEFWFSPKLKACDWLLLLKDGNSPHHTHLKCRSSTTIGVMDCGFLGYNAVSSFR